MPKAILLSELETKKQELEDIRNGKVRVQECEVWSRAVGYFRPVKDWNKGKREEYKDRVKYEIKT